MMISLLSSVKMMLSKSKKGSHKISPKNTSPSNALVIKNKKTFSSASLNHPQLLVKRFHPNQSWPVPQQYRSWLTIPIRFFSDAVIISTTSEFKNSFLIACQQGDLIQIKQLISSSSNKTTHPGLLLAISCQQETIIRYLLDNKIGLQAKNEMGNTVLHIATQYGYVDIVKYLLVEGTYKINQCANNKKENLLHTAIQYHQKDIIRLLINKGIHINATAQADWSPTQQITPIQLAVVQGDIEVIQLLMDHRADVSCKLPLGSSLLDVAVWANQIEVLRHLLTQAKHKYQNTDIQKAFFTAAQIGNIEALIVLEKQGAGVNAQNSEGSQTALHLAVTAQQEIAIFKLLELGADINARNTNGRTPKDLASKFIREEKKKSSPNQNIIDNYRRIKYQLNNYEAEKAQQQFTAPNYAIVRVKNLVFQGGGPKGIAYVAALEALAEQFASQKYSLDNIRRVAGTSAGAIISALLAVGYNTVEMNDLLSKIELTQFLDHAASKHLLGLKDAAFLQSLETLTQMCIGYLSADPQKQQVTPTALICEIYETQGLCSGDVLRKWIDDLICQKTGVHNLTFGQLHRLVRTGKIQKELHIVTINLTAQSPEIIVFNSEETRFKNICVADAVRASMSIPGLFKPHIIKYVDDVGESKEWRCVDGGLIKNFPIDIFDRIRYREQGLREEQLDYPVFNDQTLGFSLYTPNTESLTQPEKNSLITTLRDQIAEITLGIKKQNITDTHEFVKKIARIYFQVEQILEKLKPENNWRTIRINNQGIRLLDFDLTREQKEALTKAGKAAVQTFYHHPARQHNEHSEQPRDTENKQPPQSFLGATERFTQTVKKNGFWKRIAGLAALAGTTVMLYNIFDNEYQKKRQLFKKRNNLCEAFIPTEAYQELATLFEGGIKLVVISGLGGLGKTQLALHYAQKIYENYLRMYSGKQNFGVREIEVEGNISLNKQPSLSIKTRPYWEINPPIIWELKADSFSSLSASFQGLACALEIDALKIESTDKDKNKKLENLCRKVEAEFVKYPEVLLIFDNAETFIEENPNDSFFNYLPDFSSYPHVKVIITSRREDFALNRGHGAHLKLDLNSFKKYGVQLLEKINPNLKADPNQELLLEKTGYLPLAIFLMARYAGGMAPGEKKLNCKQVAQEIENNTKDALDENLLRLFQGDIAYKKTIYASLSLPFKKIQENECAWKLLVFASFMHYSNIDEALFIEYLKFKDPKVKEEDLKKQLKSAFNLFKDYSLFQSDFDGECYSIHPLLQNVVRSEYISYCSEKNKTKPLDDLNSMLLILGENLKKLSHATFQKKITILIHCNNFLEHLTNNGLLVIDKKNLQTINDIININLQADNRVSFKKMEACLRYILTNESYLTKENLLMTWEIFGKVLDRSGSKESWEEALKIYDKALQEYMKTDPYSLEVANLYSKISYTLNRFRTQKQHEQALDFLHKALKIQEEKLTDSAKQYPLIETLTNLAYTYNDLINLTSSELQASEYLVKAFKYGEQALEKIKKIEESDKEKEKGMQYLTTIARIYNSKAETLKEGDEQRKIYLEKALKFNQLVVDTYTEYYGVEHTKVASASAALGYIYVNLKNYESARQCFSRALAIRIKQQGIVQTGVVVTLNNLVKVELFLYEKNHAQINLKSVIENADKALFICNNYGKKLDIDADGELIAETRYYLALALQASKENLSEALEHCCCALNIGKVKLGENHEKTKKYQTTYDSIKEMLAELKPSSSLRL